MYFDSHGHLNEESFTDEEVKEQIKEIEESGKIAFLMNIGFNYQSSVAAVKQAKELAWCYAAIGIHPEDAQTISEEMLDDLRELAKEEKVKAIGEIGLDYHYDGDREFQQYAFRKQIQLANELKLPIVIHSRDADQITMDILKQEGAFSDERCGHFPLRKGPKGELTRDARVVMHCFSGSSEMARQYIELGATISVAGPVTYKNNRKTVGVVENTPLEYLMIETDFPYLPPVPYRGKKNKSFYVEETAKKIGEIKGLTGEEVGRVTMENAKVFFDIK